MADLKTNLLGFTMNSPIIGASGTVGYGVEYEELADFSKIGGISGKGLTLYGQYGNKGERLWETPSGLINSIGLQNPGVQHFIDVELGEMLELKQKYGPAVRPIALRMVWQAVGAVNIPVVGLGGIATGRDALEFIMAGAAAVQVGAANFANPRAMETIAEEMAAWMDAHGVRTLDEIRGCAR